MSFPYTIFPPDGVRFPEWRGESEFSQKEPAFRYYFQDSAKIRRSELSQTCRRVIAQKEKYLGRKCGHIWLAENRLNEVFIFARFNAGRHDHIVVTLACYNPNIHRFITQT